MPYTADKPPLPETPEQLRARIPGWGVDRDPADRPSVPKLQRSAELPDAFGHDPSRQVEQWPRERSIEHAHLTPVFGTSCPPKGLSGAIRRRAYARYSEARAAHWLLLLAADRVDALESHVRSFATLRPDNPITETGVRSEVTHGGIRSRFGTGRVDLSHQPLDPVIVVAPWLAAGAAVVAGARRLARARARLAG